MSRGWFGAALNACLSAFTMATIALILLDSTSRGYKLSAVIASISLVGLIALIFIQAPYRGQLRETERIQAKLEAEKQSHKETQDRMTQGGK